MSTEQYIKDNCASFAVCDSKGVSVPDDCKEYCGRYESLPGIAKSSDAISELEQLTRQQQAKITELNLEVEKLKELNRNALADRDQVSKQLTKVREANEQLAKNCEENDALKAYCEELKLVVGVLANSAEMIEQTDLSRKVACDMTALINKSPSNCLAEHDMKLLSQFVDFCIDHEGHDKALMEMAFAHWTKAQAIREGAKDD